MQLATAQAVQDFHEQFVQTASGEVIAKETLQQDEDAFGSFEDMLQAMKEDSAD